MYGFKVFQSVIAEPQPDLQVTTFDQPVQSFVWDDFTAKDGQRLRLFLPSAEGQAEEPRPQRAADPDPHPHRAAVFRPAARRLLQPRRRLEPGLYARIPERPAGQDQAAGKAGQGVQMAGPPSRRGDLQVHRQCQARRHAALLLLRIPLPAGGRRARQGDQGRRRRPHHLRRQEERQTGQGQDQEGRRLPAQGQSGRHQEGQDRGQASHPARGQAEQHPAQQVHGAAYRRRQEADRGVDRLHQHFRRRHLRPDQCRPLGARSRGRRQVSEILGAAQHRPRRQKGRRPRDREQEEQGAARRRRGDRGRAGEMARDRRRHHAGVQPARRQRGAGDVRADESTKRRTSPASRSPSASTRNSRTCSRTTPA